ncbi:hypothetical protein BLOT_002803 [Blomia tropicalis]|nr:hypothetical protein BLOT_002803 [Blomia tropicalis]
MNRLFFITLACTALLVSGGNRSDIFKIDPWFPIAQYPINESAFDVIMPIDPWVNNLQLNNVSMLEDYLPQQDGNKSDDKVNWLPPWIWPTKKRNV